MRHLASLTLAAVLTVSMAGCGGSDDPGPAKTNAKTEAKTGANTEAQGKAMDLPELAGLLDKQLGDKKTVKMTVSAQGAVQGTVTLSTLSGGRDLEITTPKDGDGEGGHYLRLQDGIYSQEAGAPQGKPWLKFPAGTKNVQGQMYGALIGTMGAIADAAQQKDLLAAGGTLAGTAPEKVNGIDTTHYTVKVDVVKGLEKIDKKAYVSKNWALVQDITTRDRRKGAEPPANLTDEQANALAGQFAGAMNGQPATFEFWVDAKKVPQKYAFSLPARTDTNASIVFADWGTAKITPPPADQVAVAPDTPSGGN